MKIEDNCIFRTVKMVFGVGRFFIFKVNYPDNTYIIQPNLSGNKSDKIAVGFSSGINAPWSNTSAIKIPVYSTDVNPQTLLTQSTATITNIKYSWILRTNI